MRSKLVVEIKRFIKATATIIIKPIIKILNIDLLDNSLTAVGIGVGYDYKNSGEKYFLERVLGMLINTDKPIFFDVGANVGTYSLMLNKSFNQSTIYAFEPNPYTFIELKKNLPDNKRFICTNSALGERDGKFDFYVESDRHTSPLASLKKSVYSDLYENTNIDQISVDVATLDSFLKDKHIKSIDLLKIDTEGNELEVLIGAKTAIAQKKIKVIQFEFNTMNIVTRTFLKDFYNLLPEYFFFRLRDKRIIPMGKYSPRNEMFIFQNIVAIRKDIVPRITKSVLDPAMITFLFNQ